MSNPNITELFIALGRDAQDYAGTRIDYYKLVTAEKMAKVSSWIITNFLLAILLALVLGFASLAAAIVIGKAIDDYALAFLMVAFFYIGFAAVLLSVRKKFIAEPLLRKFIKEFFEGEEKMNGHEKHNESSPVGNSHNGTGGE